MPKEEDVFGSAGRAGGGFGGDTGSGGSNGSSGEAGASGSSDIEGGTAQGGGAGQPNTNGGTAGSGASGGASKGGASSGGALAAGGASKGGASSGGAPSGGAVGAGGTGGFDPEGGLVAHYPFDETSGSVAANRKDATKNGSYFGACTHPAGRFGQAVGIRNLSPSAVDWVELPTGLLRNLSATSLSLWVRDLSTSRSGSRLFHFSLAPNEEIYFAPDELNSATSVAGGHLGGKHTGAAFVDIWTTSPVLTDKLWHQVAFTWSSTSIALYIDGKPAGSKSAPGARPSDLGNTSPDWLGRTLDDAFLALYGEMDDLRVYDRVLTAGEIALLYAMP